MTTQAKLDVPETRPDILAGKTRAASWSPSPEPRQFVGGRAKAVGDDLDMDQDRNGRQRRSSLP